MYSVQVILSRLVCTGAHLFLSICRMQLSLLVPGLFLTVSMMSSVCHSAAAGYKYCLYECANCVVLWGDDLYDGQRCATCCRYSDGVKVDPECKVWTTNNIHYDKKASRDYVHNILTQKRYDDGLNYKTIFGEEMPNYCFNGRK